MAGTANEGTVRLTMTEELSDLVQRLEGLNPHAVTELVLRNCVGGDPAQLCAQIARCVELRRLCCVACVLQPSHLLQLILEGLQHLERLEFSLVEVVKEAADSEMRNVNHIVSQKQAIAVAHNIRQVYVEVGGDGSFEFLGDILNFCPKLTDLHVHLVRGTFWDALLECRRLWEQLHQLEKFTFTSELPASTSYPYEPDPLSVFMNCAAICANFRNVRLEDSWSCVELSELARSSDGVRSLPSQLVVFTTTDFTGHSFWEASRRCVWTQVRQLCLLLLPPHSAITIYPKAAGACRDYLRLFFATLNHIAELNVSSFHLRPGVDAMRLFDEKALKHHLQALSAPPCWFPWQSAVRQLPSRVPNVRDLDVRIVRRGRHFQCTSCERNLRNTEGVQPPSDATSSFFLKNGIDRLTLCDVPSDVLLWFVECYGAPVTLRLAEWYFVKGQQYSHLWRLLGECSSIRCLVLQHPQLPINDEHLQAILYRMTGLQHLCLLTSMPVSESDASKCVYESAARARQMKCVHIHYRHDNDGSEQRLTWLQRSLHEDLYRNSPCFACCSTATFIGLAKPVNRNCQADL